MRALRPHFPIKAAAWTYLVCALLLLTLGSLAQQWDFHWGMVITEYVLVLLPVLLVGLVFKVRLRAALRLNPLKVVEAALIPVVVALSIPVTLFLNLLVITAMSFLGKAYEMPIPTAESLSDLGILFFIISVTAGICEEVFFRGMMLDAYGARYGPALGILVSAVLFGVFHFNPQNLLGPIFLGLLFGYLVWITDSLLAGVLAHMANNGIAVLMMHLGKLAAAGGAAAPSAAGDLMNENPMLMLASLGFMFVLAAGSLFAMGALLIVIRGDRRLKAPAALDAALETEGSVPAPVTPEGWRTHLPPSVAVALYLGLSYYLVVIK